MRWVLWLACSLAWAGKLTKGEKGLAELEAGDERHLSRTLEFVEKVTSKGQGSDPAAWLLRGRVHQRLMGRSDLPGVDPLAEALESYEHALSLRPEDALVLAGLTEEVGALEATLTASLVNAVEAREWPAAASLLPQTFRARELDEKLRGPTPSREAQLHRLGLQIAASTGQPEQAARHYAEYVSKAGQDDIGLAGMVARAWAEQGDLSSATSFLQPLSERHRSDEILLRTEVDLLVRANRAEEAVRKVEGVWPTLQESVSGAFLAAHLYETAGRPDRSRVAWERVLELDPNHVDARVELGRSLTRQAVERRDELRARAEEFEQRRPSRELMTQLKAVSELWSEAERHLVAARELAPGSRPAMEALVALYEAKMAGIDEETANRAEQATLEADRKKLEEVRSALVALGGP
jgi:tetratricopeptide (TPR) repeat protein